MDEKERIEQEVVKRYLKNKNIQFKDEEIISNSMQNSEVDIFYDNKKYQIRLGDDKNIAERIKTVKRFRKAKEENNKEEMANNFFKILNLRGPNEIFNEVVIKPAIEKINKYLNQARGVTLLINSDLDYLDPLWVKNELENYRETEEEIFDKSKNFFDEIYLICPSENIKIYPLL